MTKEDEKIFDSIFSRDQAKLIKRAVVRTEEINPNLRVSFLRIGAETNVLLYGHDLNDNKHFTMLSEESFKKIQKLKIKGG